MDDRRPTTFGELCGGALHEQTFSTLADRCSERAAGWISDAPTMDARRAAHLCRHAAVRPAYWEAVVLTWELGLDWSAVLKALGDYAAGWELP